MPNMLTEEQQKQLYAMLDEADAANPAEMEEEPEMEEAEEVDEADVINETVNEMSEGDAEAADEEAIPDPNAGAETQASAEAPALPEGFSDVGQLIAAYNELLGRENQRGDEMAALRDLNGQLVSIAEALGYGKDVESIDLSVDENLKESNPQAYMQQQVRREIAEQLRPMLEAQQKNLRQKLIDKSWQTYAKEHGDVDELMDEIRAVLGENKDLYDQENGFEAAHHMARSRRYRPEKEMMADDAFIERAAKNEKIRERVIEDYLKEISRSGKNAPASVGGGGKAVPAGRKKALSMEEAHRAARKLWDME